MTYKQNRAIVELGKQLEHGSSILVFVLSEKVHAELQRFVLTCGTNGPSCVDQNLQNIPKGVQTYAFFGTSCDNWKENLRFHGIFNSMDGVLRTDIIMKKRTSA